MNSEKEAKHYKIDVIAFFFRTRSNNTISDKIVSIINDMSLECTVNNNGIFINLNVLDEYVLDIIYTLIVDNNQITNMHNSNDDIEQSGIILSADNNLNEFIKSPDNMSYTDMDEYLLQLSRTYLTI